MQRKTIYIAGPMTGRANLNRQAFRTAQRELKEAGWLVVNPVDFSEAFGSDPSGELLVACTEAELAAIPHLDAIYLLKGWERSEGARRELAAALEHNLMIVVEE